MKRSLLCIILSILPATLAATILNVPVEYTSIQSAINATQPGDTVLVAEGIYHEWIVLAGHPIVLCSNFILDDDTTHVNNTILEPSTEPMEFPQQAVVTAMLLEDTTTQVAGFTIRDGTVGVRCQNSSPVIRNNRITGHYRYAWGPVYGCGIELDHSDAHILNNRIDHNTLYVDEITSFGCGIGATESAPIISGNVIEYNTAHRGAMTCPYGAAIGIHRTSGTISNNIIRHNLTMGGPGAGVTVYESSPHILNNLIEENVGWGAAGLFIRQNSAPLVEGNTVRRNRFTREYWPIVNYTASGVVVVGSTPQLGTESHPNSIYENTSVWGRDLVYHNGSDVYLDTFTVQTPNDHFFLGDNTILHIQHGLHPDPAYHDVIHVSPDGDDSNSGLTADDAIQSLYSATVRLQAGGLETQTIIVHEGLYRDGIGSQVFPISLVDNAHVRGEGEVLIEGHEIGAIDLYEIDGVSIQGINFRNTKRGIYAEYASLDLDDLSFDSCGYAIRAEDTRLTIDNSFFTHGGINTGTFAYVMAIGDCTVSINNCDFLEVGDKALNLTDAYDSVTGCRFSGSLDNAIELFASDSYLIQNCLFFDNRGSDSGAMLIAAGEGLIINCTFANNVASNGEGGAIHFDGREVVIRNSIFWGNSSDSLDYEIFSEGAPVTVENCIIDGGFVGEDNIDIDPLFTDDLDFFLDPSSPAIDAGNQDILYNDFEDPDNPGLAHWPSQGTLLNDMGAYGGPTPLGRVLVSGVEESLEHPSLPASFSLLTVYPNPFNNTTTVHFRLPAESKVRVAVYDLLGRFVSLLADDQMTAGDHSLVLDGEILASGVYFLKAEANGQQYARKLVLLK